VKLPANIIPEAQHELRLVVNNPGNRVETAWTSAGVNRHQANIGYERLTKEAARMLKTCRDGLDKETHAKVLQWCVNEISFPVMKVRDYHIGQGMMSTN
jgi:hypothetical protein